MGLQTVIDWASPIAGSDDPEQLRRFMAGEVSGDATDWVEAREYLEERDRKKAIESGASRHGPH